MKASIRCFQPLTKTRVRRSRRNGKILVLMALLLPTLCAFVGLVLDSSMLMVEYRSLQHASDCAASAAAMALYQGESPSAARSAAIDCVKIQNGFSSANVVVNIPPTSGPYTGNSNYAEVVCTRTVGTYFIQVLGSDSLQTVRTRSVAGTDDATAGTAVVVLDPDPPNITVNTLGLLTVSVPPVQLGGLECLGLGQLKIDGAVLVNSEWGGVDENGDPAGDSLGPPWGIDCMPILPLTKLRARDIRVVGGVDDEDNYGHFTAGKASPLRAGKLPVPDPFRDLPVPTLSSDPTNVSTTNHGGKTIVGVPLLPLLTTTLEPGVYEWINVVSGNVVFEPGIYIIRSKNPVTQLSLSVLAGTVTAEGVMFYITNSASYSPTSGGPDSSDGETEAPGYSLSTILPSTVITGILGSSYSGLDDPGSPYDGMLIYQRRWDRRPIVFACENLVLGGTMAGTVYAKWASIWFAAQGTYDMKFVSGSMRFVNVLACTIAPTTLLAPAKDVYLVE